MNCNNCLFYVAGLLAAFAYDNISYKKVATQSHTSVALNSEARYAVDGSISTCTRTLEIGLNAPVKKVWWKVDLGEVWNIYSINILFKNYDGYVERQKGRFAGFSLHVSNADVSTAADIKTSTLCYKDGPQLPPLNFTTVCTQPGRYVIFYNERFTYPKGYIHENVFTELCEVIVQGCKDASVYGSNCDTPCPTNCKDSKCQIQNGTCFICNPGWIGLYCNTKCKQGWYGVYCTQQCVKYCRESTECNHVTGQCHGGCDAGWTGAFCSKECPPGQFGLDCKELCSGRCKNYEPCNYISGVCQSGCQDGFLGTYCTNSCKEGYFGPNCSRICSPNCKPDTCQHTDGSCTSCAPGWMGYNCTTECMLSYGDSCQYACSVHCINETCDRINGSCLYGCKDRERCDNDFADYMIFSSSNHLPLFVGGIVGTCMTTIIGVVVAIFVIRKKSLNRKCLSSDFQFCRRSTSAVELRGNTEDISNYQELQLSLEENPYQSISRL